MMHDPDLHRLADDGGPAWEHGDTTEVVPYDDDAITEAGYCSRTTPVDVLMRGPDSMHHAYAFDSEQGPNRDYSREYANL